MGSTILLIIALVVLWVVVLVPLFLRWRGNTSDTDRSVERYSSSMRVLSRRTPSPEHSAADHSAADHSAARDIHGAHEYVPDDDVAGVRVLARSGEPDESDADPVGEAVRDDDAEHELTGAEDERTDGEDADATTRVAASRPMPSVRAEMLERRRRTLGTLIALALVSLILAMTWLPVMWAAQIAVDVMLLGYLVWLRQEVRREHARRARRVARAARGESVARTHGGELQRLAGAHVTVSSRAQVAEIDHEAETEPIDAVAVRRAVAREGTWEPRPVPAPSYLDAATAPRRTAVLDESHAGVVALDDEDIDVVDVEGPAEPESREVYRPRAVGD